MASRNAYRRKWLRWHKTYEKRALKELTKVFNTWLKSIDWSTITKDNYMDEIGKTFDTQLMADALYKIHLEIGKTHGVRVGSGINKNIKSFGISEFLASYEKDLVKYFFNFAGTKIETIKQSYVNSLMKALKKLYVKNYDTADVAQALFDEFIFPEKWYKGDSYYSWQALRIARTESTAAANYAALQAAEVSGYMMVKEWISATDHRTRDHKKGDEYDHLHMNGQQVPLRDEFVFNDGDDKLQYPGDPTGEAGNIINCRCTVAPIPARDTNGNLISIR